MNFFRYFIITIIFISLFCQGISCNPMAENISSGSSLKELKEEQAVQKDNTWLVPTLWVIVLGVTCILVELNQREARKIAEQKKRIKSYEERYKTQKAQLKEEKEFEEKDIKISEALISNHNDLQTIEQLQFREIERLKAELKGLGIDIEGKQIPLRKNDEV